jgi:hypothetical protein
VRVVFHDEHAAARLPIAARVSSWCHRSSLPKSARPGAVPWFYHSAAIVLSPGGTGSCDPAWRRGLPPSLKLRRTRKSAPYVGVPSRLSLDTDRNVPRG